MVVSRPMVVKPYALRRVSGSILASMARVGDESRDADRIVIEVSEGRDGQLAVYEDCESSQRRRFSWVRAN